MNRKVKLIIICLVILIILAAAAVFLVKNYIDNSKDYIKVFSTPDEVTEFTPDLKNRADSVIQEDSQESKTEQTVQSIVSNKDSIVNILFLGIDRNAERDETMGVYRTDTIMFASLNLNAKKVDVLSIPRDSYVYIPVIHKKDKINHAYVWGGMNKEGINSTIATVNSFIKYAKVDYFFAIDMEPVVDIVDELGGVELDVEIDMESNEGGLTKGYQLLDGKKAFNYITWRYSGRGDIDRIKRQQKFMNAAYEKVKKNGNILEALNIVLSYSKHIQTDLNMTQMIALSNFISIISSDLVTFYETPGYDEYIDNISYWIPDEEIGQIFNN